MVFWRLLTALPADCSKTTARGAFKEVYEAWVAMTADPDKKGVAATFNAAMLDLLEDADTPTFRLEMEPSERGNPAPSPGCRRHPWLSFPIWERSLQHSRAMPRRWRLDEIVAVGQRPVEKSRFLPDRNVTRGQERWAMSGLRLKQSQLLFGQSVKTAPFLIMPLRWRLWQSHGVALVSVSY